MNVAFAHRFLRDMLRLADNVSILIHSLVDGQLGDTFVSGPLPDGRVVDVISGGTSEPPR